MATEWTLDLEGGELVTDDVGGQGMFGGVVILPSDGESGYQAIVTWAVGGGWDHPPETDEERIGLYTDVVVATKAVEAWVAAKVAEYDAAQEAEERRMAAWAAEDALRATA